MKIYDSNTSGIAAGGAQRTQETQQAERSSESRASTSGSGGDRVEFSGTLGRLSRVLSTFQADRSNRVQALTAQYQSGTYSMDPAAISRSIITESLGGAAETGLQ
jgi:flagellar biosynthesis anti-sigma factor FlgM